MYFEAETNGVKYEINLRELRTSWLIRIKPEEGEWYEHNISKKDYQHYDNTISLLFKDSSYLVDVVGEDTNYTVYTRGSYRTIKLTNDELLLHESLKVGGSFGDDASLHSGMPGKIVKVMVKVGDEVTADQPLLIMEAMKMENEMRASKDTKIKEVHVEAGDNVEAGAVLISFDT